VIDASGGVTLSCAENWRVLVASAGDLLQYAARIVSSESLTQKLGALDNRQQRTAFESHNGRLTLAAGTGANAPLRTLRRGREIAGGVRKSSHS